MKGFMCQRPNAPRHLAAFACVWLVLVALAVSTCTTAPYTKRSQLILISEQQEIALGADAYRQVLRKEPVTYDPRYLAPVRSVGERIAQVAGKSGYQWEFAVIEKDEANAFALPGGKVAVYTGIFPIAQDTAGLAAVIGHEVGHALARHAAERISQGFLLELFATGAQIALGQQTPATRQAILAALGLGTQVGVLLPFSRKQEAEADYVGLMLMAKAGYPPQAAVEVWERFSRSDKERPPEWLSTHPDPRSRARSLRRWLSEAQRYFAQATPAPIEPLPVVEAKSSPPSK